MNCRNLKYTDTPHIYSSLVCNNNHIGQSLADISITTLHYLTRLVIKLIKYSHYHLFVRLYNHHYQHNLSLQSVQKKMRRSLCLISLATHMLESWDIIHWKGWIHSFVCDNCHGWSPIISRRVTHQPKEGHTPKESVLETWNLALRHN